MSSGQCPSCGAPVRFRPGAGRVKVCEHCQTVVVRGNVDLEAHGRVADLVDTESPLRVGLAGTFERQGFTVLGRIQKGNPTGTWDEWLLGFDDGRSGWLAESEGEWKLMFPLEGDAARPSKLSPLDSFKLGGKTYVVEEVGEAHTVSAEGQLPGFDANYRYADCTSAGGGFCSIEEGDSGVECYAGRFVALDALGFDRNELSPTPRREALKDARCPNCNGALSLQAPDAAKRVGCPYCGALVNVAYGKLAFLKLLEKPPFPPRIPLGARGTLADPTVPGAKPVEWTCLAFLIRSCIVENVRYPWEEYLLWNAEAGFRWAMNSNGWWTWLRPIPAGDVSLLFRYATWHGQSFRQYQEVFASTDYVVGECYWTVSVGEVAKASEFIHPPFSINIDQTANEATFTHGVLMDGATLYQAFGVKETPPKPQGIASAQVNINKEKGKAAWTWGGVWALVMLVLVILFSVIGNRDGYFSAAFSIPHGVASGAPELQRFSEPFTIGARVPLEVRVEAPGLSNNWLGVSVDLVKEDTGEVVSVYAEPSYYYGVSDGESWSEGSRSVSRGTDLVEPGSWVLRVTPTFDAGRPTDYKVSVRADEGPGVLFPVLVFLLLLLVPLQYTIRGASMETSRWNEAVFQTAVNVSTFPFATSNDDDDD